MFRLREKETLDVLIAVGSFCLFPVLLVHIDPYALMNCAVLQRKIKVVLIIG